ncbi:zinc ribbon domain-containing protein [Dactylosporangium sp. NPDC051485]|uniref:Zn-ribbon domain-containing OB-fold protein n=1 Tax=Dactylosporangium sp. NPDC051485 TaxID=3154846 RepID=UPI003424C477
MRSEDDSRVVARYSPEAAPFWAGLREGRFRHQRCHQCGEVVWHPRWLCPSCLSKDLGWEDGAGTGSIYSSSVLHRAPYAFWEPFLPYALGIVQMTEGHYVFGQITLTRAWAERSKEESISLALVGLDVAVRIIEAEHPYFVFDPV